MKNISNIEDLNTAWKNTALDEFIKRMVIYYDPWGFIALGAPGDEYDFSIGKIKSAIVECSDEKILKDKLFQIFQSESSLPSDIDRTISRMAEDLLHLKRS